MPRLSFVFLLPLLLMGCQKATECGDGVIGEAEACDDEGTADGDGCSADCAVEAGWRCEGAPSDCTEFSCGSGTIEAGEECDDGATEDGDGCSATCTIEVGFDCEGAPSTCSAVCGDGLVVTGESCDDANTIDDGNGCTATCERNDACGDGKVQALFEACDDGLNVGGWFGCNADCTLGPRCGDGVVTPPYEDCDDGDTEDDGNGCSAACQRNDECGDGVLQALFEQCDDHDATDDGDGCSATCQANNTCGNGVHESVIEECDAGTANNTGAYGGCNTDCTLAARCGDGHVDAGEACDVSPPDPNSGCSVTCQFDNTCGDGVREWAAEECDLGSDANTGAHNGCKPDCTRAIYCGDRVPNGPEACDDGDADSSDLCTDECTCTLVCGDRCVDPANDALNCGACGVACAADEQCVGGECCADCNLMRGVLNGEDPPGSATVIEMAGYDGASPYSDHLFVDCHDNWDPSNILCDQHDGQATDAVGIVARWDTGTGATWYNEGPGATGVLVVDLGTSRPIGYFSVFQMNADGRTTHIRLSGHDESLDSPPAWDDPGWTDLTGFVDLTPGVHLWGTDFVYTLDPDVIVLPPQVYTRYVRIEARNDRSLGSPTYIELHAVKAFPP